MRQKRFSTIAELVDHDAASPMDSATFDDRLWGLLCNLTRTVEQMKKLPAPVLLYYASRHVQWDVGNGGFAQAAYNAPSLLPLAAEGYEALGNKSAAKLIRQAIKLLPAERADLARKGLLSSPTIAQLFDHFTESRLDALNARLEDVKWEADEERVAYVRANRDAFRRVGIQEPRAE